MNNQTTQTDVLSVLNLDLANYIEGDSYINGYHNYNRPFAILEEDKAKQCGFELEIQCTNSRTNLHKFAYLTRQNFPCVTARDCSIGYGYEIVSDVLGLENVIQTNKEKYKALFEYLKQNDFVSHDASGESCGLHIHINREALVQGYNVLDTEKYNEFIDKICILELLFENFKNELKVFSRRSSNHFGYCSFLSDYTDTKKSLDVIKTLKTDRLGDHSVAINLQHSNTIEFRIFRGTLEIDTIIASMQLCYNLIEITKGIYNKTIKNFKKLTWDYIINYNDNYTELKAYNAKRNIQSNVNYIDNTLLERARQLRIDKQYIKRSEKTKALLVNIDAYLTTHARRILKLNKTLDEIDNLKMYSGASNLGRTIKQYFDIETLKSDKYNLDTTLLCQLRNLYSDLRGVRYDLLNKTINGKRYYYLSDDNYRTYRDKFAEIKKIESSEEYHDLHYKVRDLLRGGVEI